MIAEMPKYLGICLLAALIAAAGYLLLGSFLFAARGGSSGAIGEQCIGCHAGVFNRGIESRSIHTPFWERNCGACHLAAGDAWPASVSPAALAPISGTRVSQDLMWRKSQFFSMAATPANEQRIRLPGLSMAVAYRLRILVSRLPDRRGPEQERSAWFGLRPQELGELSAASRLRVATGLAPPAPVRAAIFRQGGELVIAWQTGQPLYGWVEVQTLEGRGQGGRSTAPAPPTSQGLPANQHPPLRRAADLAIEACYQCHPQSSLGTSHPVRLYGGRDVKIAAELPTVEGMLTCVTCHDPHGSGGDKLVRETIKTRLCVACHYSFKNSSPSTMFD